MNRNTIRCSLLPLSRTVSDTIVVALLLGFGALPVHAGSFEARMAAENVPGSAQIRQGNLDQGIKQLLQARKWGKHFPPGAVATNLCVAYIAKGDAESAESWCDRAVEENRHTGAARNNRGVLRAIRGNYESAVEDFREATRSRNYKQPARTIAPVRASQMHYRWMSRQIAGRNLARAEQRWAAARKEDERKRLASSTQ